MTKKDPNSKKRIMASAVKLFARKGFATVGMRELAEDADVNLAMINYFFGSKKELLKVILHSFYTSYFEVLHKALTPPGTLDEKVERLIMNGTQFIKRNRDLVMVVLTEMPHDDPEIIEYKAKWAQKAMLIIQEEICVPLASRSGRIIAPFAIGPLLISMMSSRFLFAPVLEQARPPGYGEQYFKEYPEIIATIFSHGINGFIESDNEENHEGNQKEG